MKKLLTTILCTSALTLVGCSKHGGETPLDKMIKNISIDDYSAALVSHDTIAELLTDKSTPSVGPDNSKKSVVIFFDFGCGRCAEISKQIDKLIDNNPHVNFIFKAYPSPKRDTKVSNYASLVANEAYLQGGSELFMAYNHAIFQQSLTNGELTIENVDNVVKHLGIKADQNSLKNQAYKEELKTKKLGKRIGIKGPHSVVILPTDMVNMSAQELVRSASEIEVITDKHNKSSNLDNKKAASSFAEQIQSILNKGEELNFDSNTYSDSD